MKAAALYKRAVFDGGGFVFMKSGKSGKAWAWTMTKPQD